MRPGRMTIVLMMIALGALGAWFGVRGQERRGPMPTVAREAYSSSVVQSAIPAPSSSAISYEQETSPSEEAKSRTIVSATPIQTTVPEASEAPNLLAEKDKPATAADPTIVVPETTDDLAQASSLPAKLPAELPEHPQKSEAKPPFAAPAPEPMPAAPLPMTPDTPSAEPTPSPMPELLAPPKKRVADTSAAKKPVTEKPAAKEPLPPVAPEVKDSLPPAPLPVFIEPSPVVAPPPTVLSIPKTETPRDDKQAPPPAGIQAKPLTPKVKSKPTIVVPPSANPNVVPAPPLIIESKPNVAAPPIKSPDFAAPPVPQFPVIPPVNVPPAVNVPSRVQPAPIPVIAPPPKTQEPEAPPARPPAFLLVKPRRTEASPLRAPSQPMPAQPTPALIDQSRTGEAPLASSIAQVTVEKSGPALLRQGALATYQIIVRNRGAAASGPVTVFDEIPGLAKLVAGEPAPSQLGDKAIWTLPALPANSETLLKLELRATGTGEFVGNTTVFVSADTATTRAKIQRDPTAKTVSAAPLGMQVRGPAGGAVGQQVAFEIQITNQSKQTLTDLVMHAKLSDGLTHPSGNHIEADVGDLAPGASKTFNMPATAVRAGRQTVAVKITAAGGAEAEAQASVPITSNGLSIQMAPTTRLLLDRDGDVRIDVTNHQAEGLRNVIIADTLPESLHYVAASDRGIYQASTRTVQWLIDYLPPGETRSVSVRLKGKTPGQFPKEVSARAETLPDTRAQTVVQVEGYSDLVLIVTPRDQPLELGKETVCEVRVQNFGNVAAGNVQIQVELPAGVKAGYIQGPTGHRVQGRTLLFEPIARLAARSQAVYHVGTIAQAEGDLRIRAQVVSDQTRAPVTREAALVVYRDR